METVKVDLLNTRSECDLQWQVADKLFPNVPFSSIKLSLSISGTLSGRETFRVFFKKPYLLKDVSNTSFEQSTLTVAATRYRYINVAEKRTITSAGDSFSSASWLTFLLALAFVLFQ